MEDLNKILGYYPKLKETLDKDKPKIYSKPTDTQYVKNSKINPNLGFIYDFGGTENPVKGENVVIVDFDPDEDISHVANTKKYDKDLTIYKLDAKDPNITLPDSLEVNGKLYIAYSNILKFPKFLKVKNLELFSCKMEDNLFNSKLLIEGNLDMSSVSYKGNNLIRSLITPEMGDVSKYVEYPGRSYGLPQPVVDKVRDLIEQGGGYVKGEIIIQY